MPSGVDEVVCCQQRRALLPPIGLVGIGRASGQVNFNASAWALEEDNVFGVVVSALLGRDSEIPRRFPADLAAEFFEGADDTFVVGAAGKVLDCVDHGWDVFGLVG